jgi:cellulose biosynthesis protein BcsQ
MIIAVIAPRRGLGQTVTAINLSAMLSEQIQEKVLIVDTNRYCRDMPYYLSRTNITKGLDELCSLSFSGLLTAKNFKTCINKHDEKIHFISSNEMLEAGSTEWKFLIKFAEMEYPFCIFDLSHSIGLMDEILLDAADVVLLVASDSKYVIERLSRHNDYKRFSGKLLVVVNRVIARYDNRNALYGFDSASKEFREAGLTCPVFPLAYDLDLKNECDTKSLLNYVSSGSYSANLYFRQLAALSSHILGVKGIRPVKEAISATGLSGLIGKLRSGKGGGGNALSE